jgi:hypothetical protein
MIGEKVDGKLETILSKLERTAHLVSQLGKEHSSD